MTMRFPSIRFKISLWYMLILALTLLLFSFLMHSYLSRRLIDDLDDLLVSRAEGIIDSIDAYWESEKTEAEEDGAKDFPFSKIDNDNFLRVARSCVQERSGDPVLLNFTLQIFNSNGRMVASTKDLRGIPGIPLNLQQRLRSGQNSFSDLTIESPGSVNVPARALIVSVQESSRLAYIIRVISPLTEIDRALGTLRMTMWLLLPAIVLLTGFAGAFLAKISMRPVEAIINTVARINGENLKLRVAVPTPHDEIRRLAQTFNQMLDNVDDSFSQQQRFVQDVSHELRTPLTILKGELEVSLKRVRSAREYESVLQSNLEEINRIESLVENLLTLAQFDSRQIILYQKEFDLASLLHRIVDDVCVLAEQKRIKIRLHLPNPLRIIGDEVQLKRLFFNILENALKYTDFGGRIEVEMRRQNDDGIVTVVDNGIGIESTELPFIFDRFHRGEESRKSSGFGLGLSIARSIAEVHRGGITIASLPGEGTTVTVVLPIAGA